MKISEDVPCRLMFAVPLNKSLPKEERVGVPVGKRMVHQRGDRQLSLAFTLMAVSVDDSFLPEVHEKSYQASAI